jgi:hypothetical protein
MTKRIFVMAHPLARRRAMEAVAEAPEGYIVQVSEPTRNGSQNALLWTILDDISNQVVWHGQKLSADDWKHILTASHHKSRIAPGLDGGFVVLGQATSRMTKAEFSELLELCYAFGSEQGVVWSEQEATV